MSGCAARLGTVYAVNLGSARVVYALGVDSSMPSVDSFFTSPFSEPQACSRCSAVDGPSGAALPTASLFNATGLLPSIMAHDRFMIFTGTANTRLAVDVDNHLDMSLGKMTVGRFSDGEVMVEIKIGRAHV